MGGAKRLDQAAAVSSVRKKERGPVGEGKGED